jgi:hypothetical protein
MHHGRGTICPGQQSRADPASPVASAVLVPAFAVLALAGLVPIYYLLRGFADSPPGTTAGFAVPVAARRSWPVWALPGLALLIGVAIPQLVVLALITASNRWALAAGYLAGLALVAWILVQLLVLQRYFFLQPVIAGMGALEVLLAWAWHHKTLNAA